MQCKENNMLSQAEVLYNLQKIDIALQKNRKRLAEIDTQLTNNTVVLRAKQRVDQANSILTPYRIKVKDLELELQTVQNKHKASEDRLYSGAVKNPKELQDLENEIASLKHRRETLEEHLLENMMFVEEATDDLTSAEAKLQLAIDASAQENKELGAEKNQLLKTVAAITTQRAQIIAGITPQNLKTYETLRPKKANQAVAVLRNCSCTLCGIEQTKFVEEAVRKGNELVMCLGCGRILFEMV